MEKNKKTLDYIKLTEKNDTKINPEMMESDKFTKTKSMTKIPKDRFTLQGNLDRI